MQKLWFKRRLYGWGWRPATWEGWVVVAIYLAAIIACSLTVVKHSTKHDVSFTFLLPILILTALMFVICYKRGEKPRWQWGKRLE
jgi:hypothetical protein